MVDVFRDMYEVERMRRGRVGVALFSVRACAEVPFKAITAYRDCWSKTLQTRLRDDSNLPRNGHHLESIILDVRYALRSLRKRPLYTAVAVLTLGLGIGAATAMFSVIDGVLLRQLPYRDPGRLVTAWIGYPLRGQFVNLRDDQYRLWRANNTLFEDVAIYNANAWGHGTLTGSGRPERISLGTATASLASVLGVNPNLGRWFLQGEEGTEPGDAAAVAVISHDLWTRVFAAQHDVLGQTIEIDGIHRSVVGVLPEDFRLRWLTDSPLGIREAASKEVWLPFGQSYDCIGCGSSMYQGIGRLKPGVTLEQAQTEIWTILEGTAFSDGMTIRLVPREEDETRGLSSPLVLLLAATGLLLLIACGNIATLSLGEVQSRQLEFATRSALGARSWRIVRQLLTESLLIGLLGSTVGAIAAIAGTQGLLMLGPPIPRIDQVGVNGVALGFAAALGSVAGLVFGTVPSILAARSSVGSALRSSGRTGTARARRFQRGVVVLEVALTAVLLVTAGLLTRSLSRLLSVDPGFAAERLATVHVSLPDSRYDTQESHAAFVNEVLVRLDAIPGVQAATAANNLPFPGTTSGWGVRDETTDPSLPRLSGKLFHVAPGFHEMRGMRIVDGRTFTAADGPDAPSVAVVSEAFARRLWPNEDPIGRRLVYPWTTVTVVGVVGDVRRETLGALPELVFYVPFSQFTRPDVSFAVRTPTDPTQVIVQLRDAVWSVDSDLAITHSGTMASLISTSASDERYRTLLMGAFGVLASVLAAVGVFGVTARAVRLRAREMGIRLALGARETGMMTTILRGSMVVGLLGTALGILASLWVSRLVSGLLFDIEPSDPLTYTVVASSLLVLCLIASYLPARRISNVNPVEVLRAE
jgi:predicted permease